VRYGNTLSAQLLKLTAVLAFSCFEVSAHNIKVNSECIFFLKKKSSISLVRDSEITVDGYNFFNTTIAYELKQNHFYSFYYKRNIHDSFPVLAKDPNTFIERKKSLIVCHCSINNLPLFIKQNDIGRMLRLQLNQNDLRQMLFRLYTLQIQNFQKTQKVNDNLEELQKLKEITDSDHLINTIRDFNNSILKKPLLLKNSELYYTNQLMPSVIDTFHSYFYQDLSFSAAATISGVPFALQIHHQRFSDPFRIQENRSVVTTKFDRQEYITKLKSYIPEFNIGLSSLPTANIWKLAYEKGENLLKKEVAVILEKYHVGGSEWLEYNMQNILQKDLQLFSKQILNPQYLQQINEAKAVYDQLQLQIKSGLAIDSNSFKNARKLIETHKAFSEVIDKVQEYKQKWEGSGFVQKLKEMDWQHMEKMKQLTANPSLLFTEAEKYAKFSGFQKLLIKFNQLNLGQSGTDQSKLTFNNFIANGITGNLMSKKNQYFSFIAGRQKDIVSLFDTQFGNPTTNFENNVIGITMGKGKRSGSHNHISMSYFKQQQANVHPFTISPPSRTSFAATFNNRIDFSKNSFIETEISKSAGGYQNEVSAVDSNRVSTAYFKNILSANSITDNLAFSVTYVGEYEEIGLQQRVHFRSTDNGYHNPGSPLLTRGTTEAGLDLRKSFLKQKISFAVKYDFRQFNFSEQYERKWQNHSYFIDGKIKLDKGQSVSFRYQPTKFVRIEDGVKANSNATEQLSANANFRTKIFKKTYTNMLGLMYQKNSFLNSGSMNQSATSLLVTSLQAISIGSQLLSLNFLYNHASNNTGIVFLNSSFNCDGGISYILFKRISGSTSAGYNSVKNWYQQLSLRQSLSGQIGSKCQFSLFVDARRNIKLYQPLLYNLTRGELSFSYSIN
jgi:hypothetical protein